MAGEGGRGPWPSEFPRNRRILVNFHVLSENIGTFAVGIGNSLNLAPSLIYGYPYSTGATTSLVKIYILFFTI